MNPYQRLLDRQRDLYFSEATKPAAWRLEQLDRMERLLRENRPTLCDALSNTKAMLVGNPDVVLDVFPPHAGKDIAANLGVFS